MGPLMTIEQAAEWLGIPRKTLEAKVAARKVPHTRIGKHVRFADHHLEAIVASGEQQVAKTPTLLQLAAARTRTHPPSGPTTPPPPGGPGKPVSDPQERAS